MSMRPDKVRCETCVFFQPLKHGEADADGSCRHDPPRAALGGFFPLVSNNDWCREWNPVKPLNWTIIEIEPPEGAENAKD